MESNDERWEKQNQLLRNLGVTPEMIEEGFRKLERGAESITGKITKWTEPATGETSFGFGESGG